MQRMDMLAGPGWLPNFRALLAATAAWEPKRRKKYQIKQKKNQKEKEGKKLAKNNILNQAKSFAATFAKIASQTLEPINKALDRTIRVSKYFLYEIKYIQEDTIDTAIS